MEALARRNGYSPWTIDELLMLLNAIPVSQSTKPSDSNLTRIKMKKDLSNEVRMQINGLTKFLTF